MKRQGHQTFVDELVRFAASSGEGRLTAIAERPAAPLRVAVRGRRGVGCRMVAHALNRAGIASGIWAGTVVTTPTDSADLNIDLIVYVTAEAVKPEDRDAIAVARRPVLAVLNKADLVGFAGNGPIALAQTRCAYFFALVGVPIEPMVGLLAVAALDDLLDAASWAALRMLADHPGGPGSRSAPFESSFDSFPAADNPVPSEIRLRLLDTLDLFGVALAVAAVRQGKTPAQVRVQLVCGADMARGSLRLWSQAGGSGVSTRLGSPGHGAGGAR
jgi:hypothetical protein